MPSEARPEILRSEFEIFLGTSTKHCLRWERGGWGAAPTGVRGSAPEIFFESEFEIVLGNRQENGSGALYRPLTAVRDGYM